MGLLTFRFGLKRWGRRAYFAIYPLVGVELALTVSLLALFGIADPNTYRTKLWRDGFINGFNSSPSQPIFDLVNGGKLDIPWVWSEHLTKFNLVIAVLSTFILLVKGVMHIMKVLYPALSFAIHGLEFGLYMYSLIGQTSPDTIDPEHINPGPPWYITKSCNVAKFRENIGFCKQAKATFFATVFITVVFGIHIILSLYTMLFAPVARDDDDEESLDEYKGKSRNEPQWEMVPIPETPRTPFGQFPMSPMTPRTKAFQNLQGGPTLLFPPPPRKAKR